MFDPIARMLQGKPNPSRREAPAEPKKEDLWDGYGETARRAMFFAAYEATERRAPRITPSHIVLGIVREDSTSLVQVLGPTVLIAIRNAFDYVADFNSQSPREKPSWYPGWLWRYFIELSRETRSKVKMTPLDGNSQEVIREAREERNALNSPKVETLELFLAILTEGDSRAAQCLRTIGLDVTETRKRVREFRLQTG